MRFPSPLIPARLVRRYKRFLADVILDDGTATTVHCPNPGRMIGLADPNLPVWLSRSTRPGRKLPHTLELVELPDGLVGINTGHPNTLAAEAIAAGALPGLTGYPLLRREVAYGQASRIDILLQGGDKAPCYVEVKNVHLRRPEGPHPTAAEFPDAVTARGAKHLRELSNMVAAGARSVMLYLVQRSDCDHFRIAGDIDPAYQTALAEARQAGVEVMCLACRVTVDAIHVDRPLPVVL